jgi:hypothetical protein
MANEITTVSKLSINDGGVTVTADETKQFTLSTAGQKFEDEQGLTTSAANIALGSTVTWSNASFVRFKNKSSTVGEDITLLKSAVEFAIIKPGETWGPVRVKADGTAWQAKSAAGTPKLSVVASGATA